MNDTFDFQIFMAAIQRVARQVDPVLQVTQAGEDMCLVQYPGLGDQVWVKAAAEGEKFRVYKNRHSDPKPIHLDRISPVGEGFLSEILRNYVSEVGRPQV